MPSLVEIGPVVEVQVKRFLKFVNLFLLCCYDFSLKKGVAIQLNNLEFTLPTYFNCAKFILVETDPVDF